MKIVKILITMLFVLCLTQNCFSEDVSRTATMVEMEGDVDIQTPNNEWVPAEVGMVLTEGYTVRTGDDSLAVVFLDGESETANVELKSNGRLVLAELMQDGEGKQKTMLDLAIGEILITSQKLRSEDSRFEVKTPTSIVGVRGTTFSVAVEEE